jgi:hypothetical protein
MPEMATMSAGDECTGRTRSGSTPSYGGCARSTPGREATSPNASTAQVSSAAEVPTGTAEVSSAAQVSSAAAEVPTAAAEVCSATAVTAAMVLRGSIGSKR